MLSYFFADFKISYTRLFRNSKSCSSSMVYGTTLVVFESCGTEVCYQFGKDAEEIVTFKIKLFLRIKNEIANPVKVTTQFCRKQTKPRIIEIFRQTDIFFTKEGGEAYLQDLPTAEMHRLDSGHFAVEDCLDEIAKNIHNFHTDKVCN